MELTGLERFSENELNKIRQAYRVAKGLHDQTKIRRKSGEPFFTHPLAVAQILVDLNEDYEAVCAGLLHDTIEDTAYTKERMEQDFGETITYIVDGVTKIPNVSKLDKNADLETIKKLIVSCARDIRIIKVKLADRLHNMRTLQYMNPLKQQKIAHETLSIYVPLAKMIGAYRIKNELEDLSLQYLDKENYEKALKIRKDIIEIYNPFLEEMGSKIQGSLESSGLHSRIEVRYKNVYEIYHFTHVQKNPQLFQLNGLLGIKIIIPDELSKETCFLIAGKIASLFPTKTKLSNYIDNPKPNGYESLHMTTFAKNGEEILLRIRTESMDKVATYGLTSEMYKSNIYQMCQEFTSFVLANQNEKPELFIKNLENDLFADQILVYGKDGALVSIPRGATVLDYALLKSAVYELQHMSFLVNDLIVSPDTVLQNGDRVEVLLSKNQKEFLPEWKNYVRTNLALKRINKLLEERNAR